MRSSRHGESRAPAQPAAPSDSVPGWLVPRASFVSRPHCGPSSVGHRVWLLEVATGAVSARGQWPCPPGARDTVRAGMTRPSRGCPLQLSESPGHCPRPRACLKAPGGTQGRVTLVPFPEDPTEAPCPLSRLWPGRWGSSCCADGGGVWGPGREPPGERPATRRGAWEQVWTVGRLEFQRTREPGQPAAGRALPGLCGCAACPCDLSGWCSSSDP